MIGRGPEGRAMTEKGMGRKEVRGVVEVTEKEKNQHTERKRGVENGCMRER